MQLVIKLATTQQLSHGAQAELWLAFHVLQEVARTALAKELSATCAGAVACSLPPRSGGAGIEKSMCKKNARR